MEQRTWTIHEVAIACGLTEHEISKWISLGHFRPSAPVRRGRWRSYDWRDLACLAFVGELRSRHPLSMNHVAVSVADLREELNLLSSIGEGPDLHFIRARRSMDPMWTVALVPLHALADVLWPEPDSAIIVNVSAAYRRASQQLQKLEAAA